MVAIVQPHRDPKATPLSLGWLVATMGVSEMFGHDRARMLGALAPALDRFRAWDWGEVGADDAARNDQDALTGGGRVVAKFQIADDYDKARVLIIRTVDEEVGIVTTVMLPEEY